MFDKRIKKATAILAMTIIGAFVIGCDEETNPAGNTQSQFEALASPYLICVGRNPMGVGFDFMYNGEAGGANNLEAPSVEDFLWDIKVITSKAEKTDGNHQGMPRIQLASGVQAVNYSAVESSCKGVTAYENLSVVDGSSLTWQSDGADFSMSGLTEGPTTGLPVMEEVQQQYQKLVIGDKWKMPAKNDVDGDEPVWLIKTGDGDIVKLIVTEFPADPSKYPDHDPEVTSTGFVALSWGLLD
jgi:hypothetical protein